MHAIPLWVIRQSRASGAGHEAKSSGHVLAVRPGTSFGTLAPICRELCGYQQRGRLALMDLQAVIDGAGCCPILQWRLLHALLLLLIL